MSVVSGHFHYFYRHLLQHCLIPDILPHTSLYLCLCTVHTDTVICNYCGINIRRFVFFFIMLLRQYQYIASMCFRLVFPCFICERESIWLCFSHSFVSCSFDEQFFFLLCTLSFPTKMVRQSSQTKLNDCGSMRKLVAVWLLRLQFLSCVLSNRMLSVRVQWANVAHTKIIRFVSIYGNATIHIFHRVKRFLK